MWADPETGLGFVWSAAGDGGPFSKIDPFSNTVVEQFVRNGADALGVGAGDLWITDHDINKLYRFPS